MEILFVGEIRSGGHSGACAGIANLSTAPGNTGVGTRSPRMEGKGSSIVFREYNRIYD